MKRLFCLFSFTIAILSAQIVWAVSPTCLITSTLRVGARGAEVRCLQMALGNGLVADGIFGRNTRMSVIVFQADHGLALDGIFGPLSRAELNRVLAGSSPSPSPFPAVVKPVVPQIQPPKVFSVSPEKVRLGDTVKIYGENFLPTGNTVRLRYGQIEGRFENLSSSDGKTISFVYQPPEVDVMNKEELLNLPPEILNKILDPVKALGGSVDDLVAPYRNIKNESELKQFLQNNGHSFDELYDKFFVTVENSSGRGSSSMAILTGLRKLSLGSSSALSKNNFIYSLFHSLSEIFTPKKAYAQSPEGGYNSGIIMYCTCADGYMTYMVDFSSNGGSGIYHWSSGFVPTVGNPMISGPQLGFFNQNASICMVGVDPYCAEITSNTASLPWGEGQ